MDWGPTDGIGVMEERGQQPGWIILEDRRAAPLGHVPGAIEDLGDVDPRHRGGKKADGR